MPETKAKKVRNEKMMMFLLTWQVQLNEINPKTETKFYHVCKVCRSVENINENDRNIF